MARIVALVDSFLVVNKLKQDRVVRLEEWF